MKPNLLSSQGNTLLIRANNSKALANLSLSIGSGGFSVNTPFSGRIRTNLCLSADKNIP